MAFLEGFLGLYETIITLCMYAAILIHFIYSENWMKRMHFVLVAAGFLFIAESIGFPLAQFLILAWLVVMNVPLLVDRGTAVILLIIAVLIPTGNALFTILALTLYAVIVGGFLLSALKKVRK